MLILTKISLMALALLGQEIAMDRSQDRDMTVAETEIRQSVMDFGAAYASGDVATIDSFLTDNYIQTNGGGAPFGREGYLNWNHFRADKFASGEWETISYQIEDLDVRLISDTVAIVTARAIAVENRDGEEVTVDQRMTNVWVLQDGQWKRAAFHDAATE